MTNLSLWWSPQNRKPDLCIYNLIPAQISRRGVIEYFAKGKGTMWNHCMLFVSRCLSCDSLVIALFLLHWLSSPTIIVLSEIKSTVERWSLFQNISLLKWSYVYMKNTHHFEFTLVTATICSKLTYHPFWKENHFVEVINRSE